MTTLHRVAPLRQEPGKREGGPAVRVTRPRGFEPLTFGSSDQWTARSHQPIGNRETL